jgi:branched-chain amino acid transport system permease protein
VCSRPSRRISWPASPARVVCWAAAVLALGGAPFFLSSALLQIGLLAGCAVIAAIGLNILTGTAGQFSLGHAFFVAVGAYGYALLSGDPAAANVVGLGLPSVVSVPLAVAIAGLSGLAFSPIASRVRGLYLAVASLALVFLGQHVLFNASAITGGFHGRDIAPLSVGGFTFSNRDPLYVLGVEFGRYERLWYVALAATVAAYLVARSLLGRRSGRAFRAVRDNEVVATAMGVNVRATKTAAFVVSASYAGLAGTLLALTLGRVVPESFGFEQSVDYLAMIVIGGLASVGGAVAGAVIVASLPLLLSQFSSYLPFLATPGSGGIEAGTFTRYVFGIAIVLILLFEPRGLSALGRRVASLGRRDPVAPAVTGGQSSPVPQSAQ